jgi:hypothetical protein
LTREVEEFASGSEPVLLSGPETFLTHFRTSGDDYTFLVRTFSVLCSCSRSFISLIGSALTLLYYLGKVFVDYTIIFIMMLY